MRRLAAFGAFFFVLFTAGASDLAACGEKFFFVGRLVKYQQSMAAPVPGAVLLYTNPLSKLPAVLRDTRLDELLKSVGHKVETVADEAALKRALNSGRYHLLLVDAADAGLAAQLKVGAPAPGIVVVPVLYRPSKAEERAAEQAHTQILKADKTNDAVALVNDVIRSRAKGRANP